MQIAHKLDSMACDTVTKETCFISVVMGRLMHK